MGGGGAFDPRCARWGVNPLFPLSLLVSEEKFPPKKERGPCERASWGLRGNEVFAADRRQLRMEIYDLSPEDARESICDIGPLSRGGERKAFLPALLRSAHFRGFSHSLLDPSTK